MYVCVCMYVCCLSSLSVCGRVRTVSSPPLSLYRDVILYSYSTPFYVYVCYVLLYNNSVCTTTLCMYVYYYYCMYVCIYMHACMCSTIVYCVYTWGVCVCSILHVCVCVWIHHCVYVYSMCVYV
jgi:hypothetical protein